VVVPVWNAQAISLQIGNIPVSIRQPSLGMYYIIAVNGVGLQELIAFVIIKTVINVCSCKQSSKLTRLSYFQLLAIICLNL
jgi:hypothetical protein